MKNKLKMLGMVLLFTPSVFASTDPDTTLQKANYNGTDTIENATNPFLLNEKMAEFPGGEAKFEEFILSNIKYPLIAIQQGIEGKVIANIEISKTGIINNIEIIQGIGGGCDEEVIRVLLSMPLWEPGVQAGNFIKTKKKLLFNFQN